MEKFLTVWKVSGQSGKFPDSLESFQTAWKVYKQSGKSMDSFKNFCSPQFHCMNLWNHIDTLLSISLLHVLEKMNINFQRAGGIIKHVANQCTCFGTCRKTIYALLAHMSRKQFTHFVRKVFAGKSLPTGKLRLFRSLVHSDGDLGDQGDL